MGIPSFYRWLVQKYPLSVSEVMEEVPPVVNGVRVPIDTSLPNPNGMEFDNLYLDMNGIIHPCFHPEGQPAPKTSEEVFKNVFKYIDRIFSLIRPRKLLYMAVDGVAPRAKMNQQRARRFRASKDALDNAAEAERLSRAHIGELESLDELEQTKTMDSNVITPGTDFMASLSSALQYYVQLRMNTDPGWRGIKVILSDANVPGEGEHKIMSYIRLQRNLPGFDPNTRHCLYGLDADLIMLALATHELHFSILREDVSKFRVKDRKATSGNWSSQRGQKRCGEKLMQSKVDSVNANDDISTQQFQFLNIWILRDYLAHDMRVPDQTVEADFERLIDDFVFMCLFAGNDFLPHVPSLEISEGAIDLLMAVYKKEFVRMGGYLTNSFEVNLEHVEHYLKAVGSHESAIFRKRSQMQEINRKRGRSSDSSKLPHAKRLKNSESLWSSSKLDEKKTLISVSREATYDANAVVDKVKLGEKGWKERFYTEKFETKTKDDQEKIRSHAVLKYIEGICWVMHYYYRGVCSWQWFYPYHYGPFASDFYGLGQLEIQFTLGEPFKPLNQLMSVLPAASAHALPLFYRVLMTDSSSPISDFYPTDFELDMNGKRFAWQAVCKLPFIMESRLLAETAKLEHTLTDEEKRRNSLGMDILFVHISHPLTVKIFSLCEQKKDHPELPNAEVEHEIDPKLSNGMNGYIYITDKPVLPLEIYSPIEDMEIITKNETISVFYKYSAFHPHIPRLPKGVLIPVTSISSRDVISAPMLWHEMTAFGRRISERPIPNSISGPRLAKSAHQLVSKHYLVKQRTVGSTEPEGRATAEGSDCHPSSQQTICKKEPDNGGKQCSRGTDRKRRWRKKQKALKGDVTTSCSSHQTNSKETVQGERSCVSESRHQETNGLVSEFHLIERQQVMGPAESNCHITTGSLACQPNSKGTVCEKGHDDIELSCITGSEPQKRKKVKKHRSSIANGVQSESCPTKQQQGMGSTELDGCITTDHSTSEPNLKETSTEEAGEPQKKKKVKKHRSSIANGLQSESLPIKHQQGMGSTELDGGITTDHSTSEPNLKETSTEEAGEPQKKKKVKKHRSSIANGVQSESCPVKQQQQGMGYTEFDGCITTDHFTSEPNLKEMTTEEAGESQKKKKVKKHRSSIANGLQSESHPIKQQQGMGSTELDGCITTDHSTSKPNLKETNTEEAGEPQNKKKVKHQSSIANGLHSEVDATIDLSMCHPNAEEGGEPKKKKRVKKHRSSAANGLQSDVDAIIHHSAEEAGEPKKKKKVKKHRSSTANGLQSDVDAIIHHSAEEVGEPHKKKKVKKHRSLTANGLESDVDATIDLSTCHPNAEEVGETQRNKKVKKHRSSIASGLQSDVDATIDDSACHPNAEEAGEPKKKKRRNTEAQ